MSTRQYIYREWVENLGFCELDERMLDFDG